MAEDRSAELVGQQIDIQAGEVSVKPVEGYVALIDVLGFRELVSRDDSLTEVKKYINSILALMQEKEQATKFAFVLFSDNLVINTFSDSDDDLRRLVVACSRITHALAQEMIPVRGAIARGKFIRSPTEAQGVILAGRPIVEANDYQERQNWVGTILAPSAVRGHEAWLDKTCTPTNPYPREQKESWISRHYTALHLQRYQEIPFHPDNAPYDGYAIVPIGREPPSLPNEIDASLAASMDQLNKMKYTAPDPEAQRKFTAACKFLHVTRQRWALEAPYRPA